MSAGTFDLRIVRSDPIGTFRVRPTSPTEPRRFKDCDGDTWTEYEPGRVKLTARADGSTMYLGVTDNLADVVDEHGPLTEVRSDDLDPARLERTLRAYVAELDYGRHKAIQCDKDDGVDRYPDEVENFLRFWEAAA
ncbi:hypothetical protein [Streptomyces nitrosporeus]|uniref:hypothetical protein n=1 Tax=Streptomyces nitrosporeus TaxID=28894 RepID=UPI00123E3632|nr:hypothetical protein [Streptomyces nitrosporeus]